MPMAREQLRQPSRSRARPVPKTCKTDKEGKLGAPSFLVIHRTKALQLDMSTDNGTAPTVGRKSNEQSAQQGTDEPRDSLSYLISDAIRTCDKVTKAHVCIHFETATCQCTISATYTSSESYNTIPLSFSCSEELATRASSRLSLFKQGRSIQTSRQSLVSSVSRTRSQELLPKKDAEHHTNK